MLIRRRTLLQTGPFASAMPAFSASVSATYPSHPPELAREMVGVSHGNIGRARELLKSKPSLVNAAWDWGFGDWETALGAASHVGNRAIADLLIENGATPTLFSAAMLGHLEVVRAIVAANPGAQRLTGAHSISLLSHARAGGAGAKPVFDYLQSLGDAGEPATPPLTEAQLNSLIGVYVFGPGATENVEVAIVKGQVQWKRIGGEARRLVHLGELAFFPVGAAAVRIRFDGSGSFTVSDPDLVLTGKKLN